MEGSAAALEGAGFGSAELLEGRAVAEADGLPEGAGVLSKVRP